MMSEAEPVITGTPLEAVACSAFDAAMAFAAIGPAKNAVAGEWYQAANEMAKHRRGTESIWEAALRIITERLKTYDRKLCLLTKEQHRMRDPERTLLCDIIANGQLLPDPNGSRYGQNPEPSDCGRKPNQPQDDAK